MSIYYGDRRSDVERLNAGETIVTPHSKTWKSPDGMIITLMTHGENGKPLVAQMDCGDGGSSI